MDAPGEAPYHAGRFCREERPLVFGHRGASAVAPENTLPAFAAARRLGADGVECDLRLSGDGELVVCHDPRLERLAGLPVAVRNLPAATLRKLAILPELFPGIRAGVPTLAEAVEAGGPELLWNLELKTERSGEAEPLARKVATELPGLGLDERVLVSSFNPLALLAFRAAAPLVPTAFLWESPGRPVRDRLLAEALSTLAVHPEAVLVNEELVRRWHRRGRLVNVWTVDDPEEVRRLAAAGVDGIVSNRPGVARGALAR